MKITDELCASFTAASSPLIAWIGANCHPHVTAIVDCESAELLEGLCTNIRPEPAPEIFPGTTDALAGLSVRGDDQRFCNEHGMRHSVEMRSPDCAFDGQNQ